jgi:signal transduction histidine kinase
MTDQPSAEELAQLRLRLDQSDRRTFEFVARLAHELRTPLGAILMWAHVLRTGRDTDRIPALDAIDASARAQSKMIENLLDVARAMAGRLRLLRSVVDLRTVVRAAIDASGPIANARGVALTEAIDADQVQVSGDPARLGQVVSNLIDNGIKFTSPGGSVDVRLTRTTSTARVAVRDTGRGLPREVLTDVFAPFGSPGDGEIRVAGSLGLGLAFVRLVTELHGGTVTADSEGPERGCTFTVDLPLQPG